MKILVSLVILLAAVPTRLTAEVLIKLETQLGDIVVAMDDERAPLTTAYFRGYVERGQYDGATLYRSASLDGEEEPQIVQGGIMVGALSAVDPIDITRFGVHYLDDIESTSDTGLVHKRGAVSFARDLLYTAHVIPEIVFCLRDVPTMDANGRARPDNRGFPVSGRVVSGLEVIDKVSRMPVGGATTIPFLQGQVLSEPIVIERASTLPD